MSNIFTCALSGQSPIKDPVALPMGQIYSKSLLLKKLTETSNANPFDPTGNTQVDENQLVEIKTTNEIIPLRTTASNSMTSLPSSTVFQASTTHWFSNCSILRGRPRRRSSANNQPTQTNERSQKRECDCNERWEVRGERLWLSTTTNQPSVHCNALAAFTIILTGI